MRIWLVWLMLCGVLALSPAATAAEEQVSLNFVNADIDEVIKAVSQITKRNFLIDPRVKGTITIVSSTPIPASMAYDTLLSALRLQGFAAIESDGVTKVMPEADAKLYIPKVGSNGGGDKLVTRVFMLHHESAVQMVPILRPLIAPNNVVVAYPNNNALVVTDYASNLKRIEQIVTTLDQPQSAAAIVIPVKYASVVDVAQTINRLMLDGSVMANGSVDASQRFMLMADTRTNSLLLRTDSPARIAQVNGLVAMLDVQTSTPGNIHVVYLKNAEAAQLALTLRSVLSGDTAPPAAPSGPLSPPSSSASPGASGTAGTSGTSASSSAPATLGTPSSATAAAPASGGMIQAYTASNALIITASDAVYNNLRAVVEMLDVRRAQVFVEALIVEVTAARAAEFGIQWQALNGLNGRGIIGGTNFGSTGQNIIGAAQNIGSVSQGLNLGIANGTAMLPGGVAIVNLGMLARALETDSNTNILSTPNLLTLDNEEAKIIVGQNVPFITGSYAQTGTTATATPFQTIDRKDVGLTLMIKPQISQGGTVKLQIYQEVSSVDPTTVNNPGGVTTNKRSLESTVLVDEGQIVVLGGLIQDSVGDNRNKVPLLGDIPWLGSLFRYDTRQRTKTNLMVFIRPYVMRDAHSHQGLTQDRYEYLRGEQTKGAMPSDTVLPDLPAPTLPPLSLNNGSTGSAGAVKP
jgi:general secretion pathway protein D